MIADIKAGMFKAGILILIIASHESCIEFVVQWRAVAVAVMRLYDWCGISLDI